MKIGGKGIKKILVHMVMEKKNSKKKTNLKRHLAMPFYLKID
jgi:hypothetical protein